jgi:N-methylhydantoinase A
VDVGGTFTDLVVVEDRRVVTAKVSSTPDDQSEGAMRALGASGVRPECVASLAHGTTVATNALLERRGTPTALVTTHGFRVSSRSVDRTAPPFTTSPSTGPYVGG